MGSQWSGWPGEPFREGEAPPLEAWFQIGQRRPARERPVSMVGVPATVAAQTRLTDIGEAAPDFEAEAYHNGERRRVRLSDQRGKWVVLLFYASDFTFV